MRMMIPTTTTTTTTLCPKSTWTQEKCSQIHLNVLISSKFPYFASTPTFIISPSSWPSASIFNFCGSESHGDHAWVRGSRQTRLLLYNIINNNNYFNPFTPARIIKIIHAITIQNKKYWPEVRVSERERIIIMSRRRTAAGGVAILLILLDDGNENRWWWCSTWSCWSPLFIYASIITCIQIQRKIWPEWSPGYCSCS